MIDYSKFTQLQPGKDRDALRNTPFVGMSVSSLNFSACASHQLREFKYVTVGYADDQLLLTFCRREPTDHTALKLNRSRSSMIKVSFRAMSTQLKRLTDAVNLEVFSYRFKLVAPDHSHAIISLREPYSKNRRGK